MHGSNKRRLHLHCSFLKSPPYHPDCCQIQPIFNFLDVFTFWLSQFLLVFPPKYEKLDDLRFLTDSEVIYAQQGSKRCQLIKKGYFYSLDNYIAVELTSTSHANISGLIEMFLILSFVLFNHFGTEQEASKLSVFEHERDDTRVNDGQYKPNDRQAIRITVHDATFCLLYFQPL